MYTDNSLSYTRHRDLQHGKKHGRDNSRRTDYGGLRNLLHKQKQPQDVCARNNPSQLFPCLCQSTWPAMQHISSGKLILFSRWATVHQMLTRMHFTRWVLPQRRRSTTARRKYGTARTPGMLCEPGRWRSCTSRTWCTGAQTPLPLLTRAIGPTTPRDESPDVWHLHGRRYAPSPAPTYSKAEEPRTLLREKEAGTSCQRKKEYLIKHRMHAWIFWSRIDVSGTHVNTFEYDSNN